MAYDEQLANRIRQAFGPRRDTAERKMFGGLAFLCGGRMCCGIVFRLQDNGRQTQVEFSREAWAEASPYFVSCNTVWGHLMFKPKDAVERGGPPRPLFTKSGTETLTSGGY